MEHYPAPWHLTGKGYILLYRFTRGFITEQIRLPDFLEDRFRGGFGAVMLVDYAESNAGPYGELLLIPGKFAHREKKLCTISNIYVSTAESVVNGRQNWGIPKEKAAFSFQKTGNRTERITISAEDEQIADFTLRAGSVPFPVNTRLLPFPLVQWYENKFFYTTFSGRGTGHLASLEHVSVNPARFPDISKSKPLAVIKVDPFQITFPVARTD